MATRNAFRFGRPSIAKRMIIMILLCSSVFTLAATVLQLYWDYHSERDLLDRRLAQIEASFVPSITDDLWYMDYEQVRRHLEGIRNLPDILYLKVEPKSWVPIESGVVTDERSFPTTINLTFAHNGQTIDLGTLTIEASLESIFTRLRQKVILVLVSQAIKTFIVTAFMFYLFNQLIIRHLETIARYARRLSFLEPSPPLSLHRSKRQSNRADELSQVVLAINKMKDELIRSYNDLLTANTELTDHKQNLEILVEARTRELKKAERAVIENAHRAGMAEIAIGVLHHIGNTLNSLNISSQFIESELDNSSLEKMLRANNMLESHKDSLTEFIISDPRGLQLINYYLELGHVMKGEHHRIQEEVQKIEGHVQEMRKIIASQQEYAEGSALEERIDLRELVKDTLGLESLLTERYGINTTHAVEDGLPAVYLSPTKVRFVLLHLLKNARDAVLNNNRDDRKIHIQIKRYHDNFLAIHIKDNGEGLNEQDLVNIFKSGYTTKEDAQGFGLHASANAMTEMGGHLKVESSGLGHGATFTLLFPIRKQPRQTPPTPSGT